MSDGIAKQALGERVVAGVLWIGAGRWTARLIGFVNTIVIARLLLPEDLGLVATALIVVGFFDTLVYVGSVEHLVRLPSPDREDYDTAWTLRLLVIAGAAAMIFASAPSVASYFGDARLAAVLQVLALCSFLRGFTNIGLTIYYRDLRFDRIALLGIAQRAIGVIATVACAFLLGNYWAIVIGEVAVCLAEVGLSYVVQPH